MLLPTIIFVCLRVMLPHWCRGKGLRPFFLSAHAGIWLFHQASQSNNILPNTDMQFLFWLLLIFVWKAFLLCAHFALHRWVMLRALLSVNSKWDGIAVSLVDGLTSWPPPVTISPLPRTRGEGEIKELVLNARTALRYRCLLARIDGWIIFQGMR